MAPRRERTREKLTVALASTLTLPPGATAELSALVEAQCRVMLNLEPRHERTVRLVPVEMPLANPEPTFPVMAGVPRFLEGLVGQTRAGRAFNEALGQVDGAEEVATALQALREAEATIRGSTRGQRIGGKWASRGRRPGAERQR